MNKESFQHTVNLRQKLNFEILGELTYLISKYPTMRFGQIISYFLPTQGEGHTYTVQEFINTINDEEPAAVLARFSRAMKLLKEQQAKSNPN